MKVIWDKHLRFFSPKILPYVCIKKTYFCIKYSFLSFSVNHSLFLPMSD